MILARRLLPVGLVALLALAAFAVPAAAQPAPLPTWTVGKEVGYGTTLDLGALAQTYIDPLFTNWATLNMTAKPTFNLTGSIDLWVHQKVVSKTDTYYVLATETASGVKVHLVFNATFNNLPKPGTYYGDTTFGCRFATLPTQTGSVQANLDLTSLSTTTGTSNYQISNLGLVVDAENVTAQLSGHAVLKGIPIPESNYTACFQTVSYRNENVTLTVNTTDRIRESFTPALDEFNFPINADENWWANSSAAITGNLSGTVNVVGLSSADQKSLFDNLTTFLKGGGLVATGLGSFPIDLAKITLGVAGVNYLDNGVLHNLPPLPVNQRLMALQSSMVLADGNSHEVMLITTYRDTTYGCPTPYSVYQVYSPDDGMVVGIVAYAGCSTSGIPLFGLLPVTPSNAQNKIDNTEKTYVVFPSPSPGNPISDFFFASPYLGLILIAVVVVAVVAYLVMRRRRKPATMTPPPPPPTGP